MVYVDYMFLIWDDVSGGIFIVYNGFFVKEIVLVVMFFVFGMFSIVFGVVMLVYKVGGDFGYGECVFCLMCCFLWFCLGLGFWLVRIGDFGVDCDWKVIWGVCVFVLWILLNLRSWIFVIMCNVIYFRY